MHSYEKKSKLHYSEKKNVDSVEKLSKKMEYYDKLFNQVKQKIQIKFHQINNFSLKANFPKQKH